MGSLSQGTIDVIKSMLKESGKIELLYYENKDDNLSELISEVLDVFASASPNISVIRKSDAPYNVRVTPCIELKGKNKGVIRYYGLPSGLEFAPFINQVKEASLGSSLAFDVKAKHTILVFTIPNCTHCPKAVHSSHSLAMSSDNVVSEMIDAQHFPEMSSKFNVASVPHIIIDDGKKETFGEKTPEDLLNLLNSL